MSGTIQQGANVPLNTLAGSVPDVSGALQDYYQPMTFSQVTKTVVGFQAVETTVTYNFQGVVQPFTARQMAILPIGERAWTYFTLMAQPVLTLQVDSVVTWLGKQTRIMSRKDYRLYGYVEYVLCQDWSGAGPVITVPPEPIPVPG